MTAAEPWHDSTISNLEWSGAPQLWTGDGKTLTTGGSYWGAAVAELISAPRLIGDEPVSAVAAEQRRLATQIARSLRSWQNSGGLEIRWIWGGGRLRIVLIARSVGLTLQIARVTASKILEHVCELFPPAYRFGPLEESMPVGLTSWAEIERAEEIRSPGPFVPPSVASFYYLVYPLAGDATAWAGFPKILAELEQPGFLSIALLPTRLTDLEQEAVDRVCTLARHLSEPQQEYDYFRNPRTIPGDAAARDVLSSWQQFSARSGLLARVGVAADDHDLPRLTALIGSVIADGPVPSNGDLRASFKVIENVGEYEAFVTANFGLVLPRSTHPVWSLPGNMSPISLERMPYFFPEDQAGGLLILPVPDRQGVPGLPLSRPSYDRRSEPTGREPMAPSIRLGVALHQGRVSEDVSLPLGAVNRHVLVVGKPGMGKTTTVMTILADAWRRYRIPFFVIEPSTQQYRNFLRASGMEHEVRVIVLGREDISPLRLNPLEPPPGVRREVHASSLLASLKMALPLSHPLPEILENAIERAYVMADWETDTTVADGLQAPTLRDLIAAFEVEFRQLEYTGDALNVGRAGRVRLQSLLSGSRGRMLDTTESTDFATLLDRPVVVELKEIRDPDDMAIVTSFILDRIRAAAEARGSTGGELHHVTVLEEAHRLLSSADSKVGELDDGNARAHLVRSLVEAIAELRSVGEGFILSSQRPTQLSSDAVANTGTRILHGLDASDREAILDDFDASPLDRQIAARLHTTEALVRWPDRDEPSLIQVRAAAGLPPTSQHLPDEVVREMMARHRQSVVSLLPFRMCTRAICRNGCDPSVRAFGTKLAARQGEAAMSAWNAAGGETDCLPTIAGDLVRNGDGKIQTSYCGAVHLALGGKAFRFREGTNCWPMVAEAIEREASET